MNSAKNNNFRIGFSSLTGKSEGVSNIICHFLNRINLVIMTEQNRIFFLF